jgi:hypothetical protein
LAGFQITTYKGRQISIVDLSNTKVPEQTEIIIYAQTKIATMAPKSALIITDETDAEVNKEAIGLILNFAKSNTPYVKASAAVGAEKLKAIILTNITTNIGRDIKSFATREEAMDWLVAQP